MQRSALAFLIFTLSACAVHNTVADDDRTPSEQLASELSASCASICDWAVQCPAPTCDCTTSDCSCARALDPLTCPAECAKGMATYQGHGDACASAGLGILMCLSSANCANIYQNDLCAPSADAISSCGLDSSTSSVGPSGVTSTGTGSAGSGNSGGSPSDVGAGGSATTGAKVHCDIGYGGGAAGSGNVGGSAVTCEQGYESCADGHSYYTVCVMGDHAELVCSCFLDSTLQTSFAPSVQCPALPEIDAGCHWSLTQD